MRQWYFFKFENFADMRSQQPFFKQTGNYFHILTAGGYCIVECCHAFFFRNGFPMGALYHIKKADKMATGFNNIQCSCEVFIPQSFQHNIHITDNVFKALGLIIDMLIGSQL